MRKFKMGWLVVWVLGTLGVAGGALWGGWRAADYRALWRNAEGRIAALEDQLRREQSQRQRIVTAPVPVVSVAVPAEPPVAPLAPDTADAERLAELERELARRDALIEALRERARPPEQAERGPRPGGREWLENLERDDPERFAQIQQRREEMRQRVQNAFAQRASFFLERDLNGLDEAAVAEHQQLLAKLTQAWKLSDQLQTEELEGEARRDAGQALFENLRELSPMMEAAREEEFYRIGRAVGYGPEEATAFVDYLNQVLEVTSGPRGMMGRQRGGVGGGGRPDGAAERPAR